MQKSGPRWQLLKRRKYRCSLWRATVKRKGQMVVYRALYGGGVWVRPAAMWLETVRCGGTKLPRFRLQREAAVADLWRPVSRGGPRHFRGR